MASKRMPFKRMNLGLQKEVLERIDACMKKQRPFKSEADASHAWLRCRDKVWKDMSLEKFEGEE